MESHDRRNPMHAAPSIKGDVEKERHVEVFRPAPG